MSDIWQWKGDETTGAGLINFTGTATVAVSGNVTIGSFLKGSTTTAYSATLTGTLTADITTTSGATSIVGFNSILLQTTVETSGKTASVLISGSLSSGGTMVPIYDKDTSAQMTTGAVTGSRTVRFTGLPDYLGFSTTLTSGMTAGSSVTVILQPFNL
jgi:hypothetical protein